MSRGRLRALFARFGFPRVSGDEPTDVGTELSIDVFSPRERG